MLEITDVNGGDDFDAVQQGLEAYNAATGPDATSTPLNIYAREDGELVGGLYGVVLNGAFFGESMFHRVSNASKVALVHLVERLRAGGFTLLDIQYSTDHLAQFGVIEIPRLRYLDLLDDALDKPAIWATTYEII